MKLTKLLKCACFAVMSVGAFAMAVSALGGAGTQAEPYTVSDASDLQKLSDSAKTDSFSGKYIVLTDNIEVLAKNDFVYDSDGVITGVKNSVSAFTPIGSENVPFEGNFDGNGYAISGLYFDGASEHSGLFGYASGAKIKNVTIFNSLCKGSKYAGMLCAYADGTTNIDNVNISGSVIGNDAKLSSCIGGVVGYIGNDSAVNEAVSYACVSGAKAYSSYTGGVAGLNKGTVSYSAFGGKVLSEPAYFMSCCGGVVGANKGTVTYCTSEGTVGGGTTTESVSESYVGGIAGHNEGGTLSVCVNHAVVSNASNDTAENICAAGGVVGINADGSIQESANYGNITSTSVYAGGVAGIAISETNALVEDSYNEANVSSQSGVSGGIVGFSSNASLNACLNVGNASGDTVGGVMALSAVGTSNNLVNCYNMDSATPDTNTEVQTVSQANIKSNTALNGFETLKWNFQSGSFPVLANESGIFKPSYLTISSDRAVVLNGVADEVNLTNGNVEFSEDVTKTGIYKNLVVTGNMSGAGNYFAPAPTRMDIAVVAGSKTAQILSVEQNRTDSAKVDVSAYMPGLNSTNADFVAAVYTDNALKGVTIEQKQIDDEFYVFTLTLPNGYTSTDVIRIFAFETIGTIKPICQSK